MSDTAILCLGGNAPETPARLSAAIEVIASCGTVTASSGVYSTVPEYGEQTSEYYNIVLSFVTDYDYDSLRTRLKSYERRVRTENASPDLVNIDIDIVEWSGTIVRPRDAAASYFRKGLELLGSSE